MLLGMDQARDDVTPRAEALPAAEMEALCRELEPPADEAWAGLPWEISLLEADRVAAAAGKPLVMVVRSGHPLGCT